MLLGGEGSSAVTTTVEKKNGADFLIRWGGRRKGCSEKVGKKQGCELERVRGLSRRRRGGVGGLAGNAPKSLR